MLELLPDLFRIFFLSMIPWFESRYVIPIAVNQIGWEWWQVFPVAVIGNMIPIPFVLLFFVIVEKFLRRFDFWANLLDKLFAYTRRRADKKVRKYEHLALLLFVAIPVPFTGAWTGALIAYVFNLKFLKSLITIFIGVIIAASIMTLVTLSGLDIILIFAGVIIAGIIMTIVFIIGMYNTKKK